MGGGGHAVGSDRHYRDHHRACNASESMRLPGWTVQGESAGETSQAGFPQQRKRCALIARILGSGGWAHLDCRCTHRKAHPFAGLLLRPSIPACHELSAISQRFGATAAMTLYAATGRRIPLSASSPTCSAMTASSTAKRTRGLIKTWPGLASSQRREATLDTFEVGS